MGFPYEILKARLTKSKRALTQFPNGIFKEFLSNQWEIPYGIFEGSFAKSMRNSIWNP